MSHNGVMGSVINGTEIKSLLDMGMVNKETRMTEELRLDVGRHYQFLLARECKYSLW